MDFSTFTNFMYTRDFSITFCVRHSRLPVKRVLETRRKDVLWDSNSMLLHDELIQPLPRLVQDYIKERDRLFPAAEPLFPTTEGNQYYPDKFGKRVKRMLEESGQEPNTAHPRKLTEQQYQAIETMRFSVQRQFYQVSLAVALCSYLGMRPSEVAMLEKRDVDFSTGLINLRDTKSQEDQVLPLIEVLVAPLIRYTRYLKHKDDPLFVNTRGVKWVRRDVSQAVADWGKERKIPNLTPRKLRASLGATLARMKVEGALIAKVLRHKDPATALRHYQNLEIEEARHYLDEAQNAPNLWKDRTYNKEFAEMYAALHEAS